MSQFEIKPAEAAELEELEQRELRRRRTENALRRAPNADKKYKLQFGKITMDRFNDKQKREKLIKSIYKRNSDKGSIADAMVRGDSV